MKPLGYYLYFISNKRKVIGIVLSIAFSILLVGVFQMYSDNMTDNSLRGSNCLKYFTEINFKNNHVQKEILAKIRKDNSVDKVIAVASYNYKMKNIIGSNMYYEGYFMDELDIKLLMKRMKLKLSSGYFPKNNTSKIIITARTARTRNISLGGYMGSKIRDDDCFYGKYKVCGILNTNNEVSFSSASNMDKGTDTYLILPKKGAMVKMNRFLKQFRTRKYTVYTYKDCAADAASTSKNFNNIFNIIVIIIITVLSITLGISSYVHYFQRRNEFGLLGAVGYSKISLILKMAEEILISTATGFVLGFIFIVLFQQLQNTFYLNPQGIYPFRINLQLIPKLIAIPISISIFSIIPASRLLSKVEPVSSIERMN
jgi:ABC-type lipoprotein release transport system permease subunit